MELNSQNRDTAVEGTLQDLLTQVTNEIAWAAARAGVTREELARRLEVPTGRLEHILTDPNRLTLREIGTIGIALGQQVDFTLTPNEQVDNGPIPEIEA